MIEGDKSENNSIANAEGVPFVLIKILKSKLF